MNVTTDDEILKNLKDQRYIDLFLLMIKDRSCLRLTYMQVKIESEADYKHEIK